MFKKLLFAFTFSFFACHFYSQVFINEYSVSNATLTAGSQITDNTGGHPDWVEFYNSGSGAVDMSNWTLTDDPSKPPKFTFPSGTSVSAGAFLRVWCSGKGSPANSSGNIHTNFKLTQCKGDWIVLQNGSSVVDSVQLRRTQVRHSQGRTPNGSATWKVYTTPTPNASNTGTAYDGYAPRPVLSPNAGFYSGGQNITITATPSADLTIYYTVNGAEPTTTSATYAAAVNVATTTVVRAYAVSSNTAILPSFMETNTYFIGETIDSHFSVVSISGGNPLYNPAGSGSGLMGGSTSSTPKTHLEYFEAGVFQAEAYGLSDKHGNDSWQYPQRGIDFETKDDYGYSNAINYKAFNDGMLGKSKRKEFQHVILKAAASDNYPCQAYNTFTPNQHPSCHMRDAFVQSYSYRKGLELDGRRVKPAILFVNGAYHGVYEMREAFETDYTDYYYQQPKDSIDNLAYWGSLQIRDGSDTGWVNLYNFVMGNPMTNAANYAYVESKLNFRSLIDYMVYNSYVVNSDFVNWNSAWWRGRAKLGDKKKWRYWMWDMDNVYDLGENYSGLPTTDMESDPCDYTNTFQNAGPNEGHPDILDKLLDNPDFKSLYINRYADLLNSAFKCDSIMTHFNYFRTFLSAEMPRQITRWSAQAGGGNLAEWNKNMDTLQAKILRRCSYIESKIESCYNVTATPLTVDVDPHGAGVVKLNSIWLETYPFSGNYFAPVNMTFVEKVVDTNYVFDYWEFQHHTPAPGINNDSVTIAFSQADNVIAHYKLKIVEPLSTTDVLMPTGFSPNGDTRNDVLYMLGGKNVKSVSMQIWNRWGQMVFSTTEQTKGWDGNFQGTPAQTGVYAYLIKYVDAEDNEKTVKGNVTLLR